MMLQLASADPGLPSNATIPCPVWRVWPPSQKFKSPRLMGESSCLVAKSVVFEGTFHTHVTLHQTEEAWQRDPRRDQVLSEVAGAIQTGLNLFGSHAGSPSNPLTIIATLSQGQHGFADRTRDRVDIDEEASFDWNTPVTQPQPPCYILIHFPYWSSTTFPFTGLKKEVVRRMYQCVIKYHHPRQNIESFPPWWSPAIARFFDGLAWPATLDILSNNDGDAGPLETDLGFRDYPEEYPTHAVIYQKRASASLFWHSVHNAGWSPEKITEWMKRRPDADDWNEESKYLSTDPQMGPLFHDFGKRLVDGEIRYPGGERINVTTGLRATTLGRRLTEAGGDGPEDALPLVGQPGVVQKWGVRGLISGWQLRRVNATFVGGQRLNISVSHQVPGFDDMLNWSFKPAGEKDGWRTGKGGEWETLVVPGDNGTTREYDFVVTSTASQNYGLQWLVLKVLGL